MLSKPHSSLSMILNLDIKASNIEFCISHCNLLTLYRMLAYTYMLANDIRARDFPISLVTCWAFVSILRQLTNNQNWGLAMHESMKYLSALTSLDRDSRAFLVASASFTLHILKYSKIGWICHRYLDTTRKISFLRSTSYATMTISRTCTFDLCLSKHFL